MERKRVHQGPRPVTVKLTTVLLMTLWVCGRSSEEPITCEAGHFVLGQNGSLICLFRQNMIGSKRHVCVVHYPFQSSNDFAGNDVLRCSGLDLSTEPICMEADGYQFHGDISDRLTLTIPGMKSSHAGRYLCQLVPPDGRPVHFCNLTVEGTNGSELTPVLTTSSTGVNTASESGNDDITYFAFSAVIAILLGVIAYFAITRWRQRRNEIARKRNPEDPAAASMIRSGDAQQGKTTCSVTAQTGKSLENFKSSLKKLSLTADKT